MTFFSAKSDKMRPKALNFTILIFIAIFTSACSKGDEADAVDAQKRYIESYLNARGLEYTHEHGLYRALLSRTGSGESAQRGDSVYFYFSEYMFGSGGPDRYIYTNMREVAEAAGAETALLSFDPKRIKLGAGQVLAALDRGMENTALGDTLLLLIPSDHAYGDKNFGAVDRNTAVSFVVVIDRIIKN